ncbi:hypothetical protein ID855_11205 [Xenorhabdus sp. ZM]|uniref:hypothetical protein n=1 Tax=Xenorhabdus szentirmaii TaxID=290112 RepID=UPI0019C45BAD|nr:hypothetical protein [Xenorhabdus sp. ZM]MBD2805248.1 hypothetical protein [Xenorhabdus sp. ZM]
MRKRLINKEIKKSIDFNEKDERISFDDMLLLLAMSIENGLIRCGARPEIDYNYVDLFNMATNITKDKELLSIVNDLIKR